MLILHVLRLRALTILRVVLKKLYELPCQQQIVNLTFSRNFLNKSI